MSFLGKLNYFVYRESFLSELRSRGRLGAGEGIRTPVKRVCSPPPNRSATPAYKTRKVELSYSFRNIGLLLAMTKEAFR